MNGDADCRPVSLSDLLQRVDGLLRQIERLATTLGAEEPRQPGQLPGLLVIDETAHTVLWRHRRVHLPLTQVWMVRALSRAQGQALPAKALMHAAGIVVEPNTVAAHVMAIRVAFRRVDPGFDAIRTERSRGYRWVEASHGPGQAAP
jgi:DNA-binding response OmpR family regulator